MNNVNVTIGTMMPVVFHRFVPIMVQHTVTPISVQQSFQAVMVQHAKPRHTRVALRPVQARWQRRERVVRASRTPRQPRARHVTKSGASTSRSDEPPPPGRPHALVGAGS